VKHSKTAWLVLGLFVVVGCSAGASPEGSSELAQKQASPRAYKVLVAPCRFTDEPKAVTRDLAPALSDVFSNRYPNLGHRFDALYNAPFELTKVLPWRDLPHSKAWYETTFLKDGFPDEDARIASIKDACLARTIDSGIQIEDYDRVILGASSKLKWAAYEGLAYPGSGVVFISDLHSPRDVDSVLDHELGHLGFGGEGLVHTWGSDSYGARDDGTMSPYGATPSCFVESQSRSEPCVRAGTVGMNLLLAGVLDGAGEVIERNGNGRWTETLLPLYSTTSSKRLLALSLDSHDPTAPTFTLEVRSATHSDYDTPLRGEGVIAHLYYPSVPQGKACASPSSECPSITTLNEKHGDVDPTLGLGSGAFLELGRVYKTFAAGKVITYSVKNKSSDGSYTVSLAAEPFRVSTPRSPHGPR
jgi:hypothetical protein